MASWRKTEAGSPVCRRRSWYNTYRETGCQTEALTGEVRGAVNPRPISKGQLSVFWETGRRHNSPLINLSRWRSSYRLQGPLLSQTGTCGYKAENNFRTSQFIKRNWDLIKKKKRGAGELAQLVKGLVAKPDFLSSIPGTHKRVDSKN